MRAPWASMVMFRCWRPTGLGLALGATVLGGVASLAFGRPDSSFGLMQRIMAAFDGSMTKSLAAADRSALDSLGSGRIDLWSWVVEQILDKPLIGWGYFQMASAPGGDLRETSAHNFLLDYMFAWGIPFGLLASAVLIGAVWFGLRRNRFNPAAIPAGVAMIGMLVDSLMTPTITMPYPLLAAGTMLGLLWASPAQFGKPVGETPGVEDASDTQP